MAGYYPPEIMLLQVCPCQSSAGSHTGSQTKGGSGSTQGLMAIYPRMGWPRLIVPYALRHLFKARE